MLKPRTPDNEEQRLRALRELQILDTPSEDRFNRLTRIAQHILQVPIALVSLLDADRQWFKSRQGLDALETARDISFCGHAILGSEVFVVADTATDPRFADNPLVLEAPNIRFYAGAPLTLSSGERVGTLCAIDRIPRQVTNAQLAALQDLAACVVEELERIRHRQDAKKSAQLVASIVETVIDGIITIDSKGTVQSFNSAAERLFGYVPAEVIGQNVKLLMPQPYATEHDGYLKHYRETGEPRIIGIGREVVGRRKDGSVFPMDLAVSEMQQPGQTLFVGIVRDITERKRGDQMKIEFVATVSHELRTPLTSVSGALGLVCGGVLGPVSEQAKKMLDIAYRNSQRLSLLINDLLDMEKLAAGKMRFDLETVELMPLIERSIENTRVYAQQYQVNLLLQSRLDGVTARVDASRLQQVLANFLSNAAKFSPQGGQVEIKVEQYNASVRVIVQDHGPGVPEEFTSRIFQKFSQADSSDTRQRGGTGLGLAISKELIENMNGAIGFTSNAGSGACFYFDLPIIAPQFLEGAQQVAAVPRSQRASPDHQLKILHIEDDADLHHIIATLGRDIAVFDLATTLAQARQKLQQERYDLVILDIGLPDGIGFSLLPEINALQPTPLVIVLSGTELSLEQQHSVHQSLVKSRTSAENLLSTIQQSILNATLTTRNGQS